MIFKYIESNLTQISSMFVYMKHTLTNAYDESKNSKEIISLEIAENMLMSKELSEFLSSNMKIISNLFSYNTSSPDSSELIKGLVEFYNNSSFNSIISVEKNHIYFIFECIILLDQCF